MNLVKKLNKYNSINNVNNNINYINYNETNFHNDYIGILKLIIAVPINIVKLLKKNLQRRKLNLK